MDDSEFDSALIAAAFDLAGRTAGGTGERGRGRDAPPACRCPRARARFPGRAAILLRFGVLADQAALVDTSPPRAASATGCSTC